MKWDPQQYEKYASERARPFLDLIGRIRSDAPRRVVDLGCGPGTMTVLLGERWPGASIEGVDSSPEMIAQAKALASPVAFRVENVTAWTQPADADVIVSNATLHWVPTHQTLVGSWARALPEGGWLAFQVPGNFEAPSHTLLRDLAASPTWSAKLSKLRDGAAVETPERYASLLVDAGLEVDAWETTYLHLLRGENPVLEWLRGTALRPVLGALSADDDARFSTELAERLRDAYPATPHGTFLPFRRIFVVGQKLKPAKT